MKRPTYRELNRKIEQDKETVSKKVIVLDPEVIAIDALELGYEIKDLESILSELLSSITPKHYAGTYPPQKSYEEDILNQELFAFKVISGRFGCEIYVKYVLEEDSFWLVSLHQHREKEQGT